MIAPSGMPSPDGPDLPKGMAMPTSRLLTSILDWLHRGYPEGVPPKDFYPLLALMARTLSDEELDQIANTLIRENSGSDIHHGDAAKVIAQVKQAPPNQADVRDVASRLAAAGWPLGEPDAPRLGAASPAGSGSFGAPADLAPESDTGTADATSPGTVQRIVEWFNFGYPQGVPATDRVPILALLRRRLTDDEVEAIARGLAHAADRADNASVSPADVESQISEITQQEPTTHEMERVAARLAARGWPLAWVAGATPDA